MGCVNDKTVLQNEDSAVIILECTLHDKRKS